MQYVFAWRVIICHGALWIICYAAMPFHSDAFLAKHNLPSLLVRWREGFWYTGIWCSVAVLQWSSVAVLMSYCSLAVCCCVALLRYLCSGAVLKCCWGVVMLQFCSFSSAVMHSCSVAGLLHVVNVTVMQCFSAAVLQCQFCCDAQLQYCRVYACGKYSSQRTLSSQEDWLSSQENCLSFLCSLLSVPINLNKMSKLTHTTMPWSLQDKGCKHERLLVSLEACIYFSLAYCFFLIHINAMLCSPMRLGAAMWQLLCGSCDSRNVYR